MLFQNPKLKYFKDKLKGVQKMTWDLEFKLFKTKELREDVRKQFDRTKEAIDGFEIEIKKRQDKQENPDTVVELQKQRDACASDLNNLTTQLGAFDQEIDGTQLNVDGTPSIQAQLDGLHELKVMLTDYIAQNL